MSSYTHPLTAGSRSRSFTTRFAALAVSFLFLLLLTGVAHAVTPTALLTVDTTSTVGSVNDWFYGVNTHLVHGAPGSRLDMNGDDAQDTPADDTWARTQIAKVATVSRGDAYLEFDTNSQGQFIPGTDDNSRVGIRANLLDKLAASNQRMMPIIMPTPAYLANKNGDCTGNAVRCEPTDKAAFADLTKRFFEAITRGDDSKIKYLHAEIGNEVDARPFWLPTATGGLNYTIVAKWNQLYKATASSLKQRYPTLPVGGSGWCSVDNDCTKVGLPFMDSWMGNNSGLIDFVTIHSYLWMAGPTNYYDELTDEFNTVANLCAVHNLPGGKNCPIYITEMGVNYKGSGIQTPESSAELALAFHAGLNTRPATSGLYPYEFSEATWEQYYADTNNNRPMITYPQLENTKAMSFDVVARFKKYHPESSTIYKSTTNQTSIRATASNTGGKLYVTITNAYPTTMDAQVKLTGMNAFTLTDVDTAATYSGTSGSATIPLMAGYSLHTYLVTSSATTPPPPPPATDTTPPTLSNQKTGAVAQDRATITWNTNESADASVSFGTTTALGSHSGKSSLATSQSVTLVGLNANTLYHYTITSCDANKNCASIGPYTLTTLSIVDGSPPTASIINPDQDQVFPAGTTTTTLDVSTDESTLCRYDTTDLSYAAMTGAGFGSTWGTTHSATVTGLVSDKTYTFYVRCKDDVGNAMRASETVTFRVAAATVTDGSAPIISDSGIDSVTTNEAHLTWTTNENANSMVTYGTTSALGIHGGNSAWRTAQSVTISGLSPGTQYYYTLTSCDQSGNCGSTEQRTFVTVGLIGTANLSATVLYPSVSSFPAGTSQVTLRVLTTEPATCRYGASDASYATMVNSFTTSDGITHNSQLTGLAHGQDYSYWIRCADASGNAMMTSETVDFSIGLPNANPPTTGGGGGGASGGGSSNPAPNNPPADPVVNSSVNGTDPSGGENATNETPVILLPVENLPSPGNATVTSANTTPITPTVSEPLVNKTPSVTAPIPIVQSTSVQTTAAPTRPLKATAGAGQTPIIILPHGSNTVDTQTLHETEQAASDRVASTDSLNEERSPNVVALEASRKPGPLAAMISSLLMLGIIGGVVVLVFRGNH